MAMPGWIHLGGIKNIICQYNVTISHSYTCYTLQITYFGMMIIYTCNRVIKLLSPICHSRSPPPNPQEDGREGEKSKDEKDD
jgi:hypothetical protein